MEVFKSMEEMLKVVVVEVQEEDSLYMFLGFGNTQVIFQR